MDLSPQISCCQARSEYICNHISLLALGADPSLTTIESGSMGTVYKIHHPVTSKAFAVKAFHAADGESIPDFAAAIQHEFSVGAAMANHPAFARSYALLTDAESLQIHLIMEHVPLALLDLLDRAYWTHDDTHCLFTQVLQAVLDLHDSGFAHRDLKPGNILLSTGGHVKLIDFGEAVPLDGNATSFTGTRPYIAPELYAGEVGGYDAAAADLWSLGMLLLRLYLEDDPWDDSSPKDEYFNAFLDNPHALLDGLDLDADIEQAMLILLDMEPSNRYQIRQLWDGKLGHDPLCAVDEAGMLHLPLEFT
ncbi:kinase-like protein [Dothidotthia symphoricarpi CBS 119687]|uniref:Kinase-like protein n=1 Tax=Dothidotthia symphoricarpi CBS 119687 TaxID=1392245 RepID=A0A6A5ZY95_9PLEO|nr:kinase-like protein [Dothidotthia symphoricarpi CBS 119687]KAF2123853.1 kinase-like protein [Dothidotthia symphoricarpi CBS 119687]